MKRCTLAKKVLVFGMFVLATTFAQAPDPMMREKITPYLNLMETVGLLLELDSSDLPLTSEQALQLLPILTELKTSSGYTSEYAAELLEKIELSIVSLEQLIWMDGKLLERMEQGSSDSPGPGQASPDAQGPRPGGAGGMFQKIMQGEPVNVFTDNPAAMSRLEELMASLNAKTP
jgi:hypothetical protein